MNDIVINKIQRMDIEIVKSVIKSDLDNLVSFTERIMEFADGDPS